MSTRTSQRLRGVNVPQDKGPLKLNKLGPVAVCIKWLARRRGSRPTRNPAPSDFQHINAHGGGEAI
jgi:hypothetical protein